MYFINFSKCSICNQKKSVAINKKVNSKKVCVDCNVEHYNNVANNQKDYWINGNSKNISR